MDPDAMLRRMRELTARKDAHLELDEAQVSEFVRLFVSLDEWLSGNGFLPEAWAGGHNVPGES